jgi:hypothetical protein
MRRYHFEIVRRAFGRFGWVIVDERRRRRRVIARSERSYRSKKRVRRAIDRLGGGRIVDRTKEPRGFQLPRTSFQLLPGVTPLIVGREQVRTRGLRSGRRLS